MAAQHPLQVQKLSNNLGAVQRKKLGKFDAAYQVHQVPALLLLLLAPVLWFGRFAATNSCNVGKHASQQGMCCQLPCAQWFNTFVHPVLSLYEYSALHLKVGSTT